MLVRALDGTTWHTPWCVGRSSGWGVARRVPWYCCDTFRIGLGYICHAPVIASCDARGSCVCSAFGGAPHGLVLLSIHILFPRTYTWWVHSAWKCGADPRLLSVGRTKTDHLFGRMVGETRDAALRPSVGMGASDSGMVSRYITTCHCCEEGLIQEHSLIYHSQSVVVCRPSIWFLSCSLVL